VYRVPSKWEDTDLISSRKKDVYYFQCDVVVPLAVRHVSGLAILAALREIIALVPGSKRFLQFVSNFDGSR
jgi:hypothetical protein